MQIAQRENAEVRTQVRLTPKSELSASRADASDEGCASLGAS